MRLTRILALISVLGLAGCLTACSTMSARYALENQQRATEVENTLFSNQQQSLKDYLYNETEAGLLQTSDPNEVHTLLNKYTQERDTLDFWALQHERVNQLRLIGVNTKLWADQSILDLLYKDAERRLSKVLPDPETP